MRAFFPLEPMLLNQVYTDTKPAELLAGPFPSSIVRRSEHFSSLPTKTPKRKTHPRKLTAFLSHNGSRVIFRTSFPLERIATQRRFRAVFMIQIRSRLML